MQGSPTAWYSMDYSAHALARYSACTVNPLGLVTTGGVLSAKITQHSVAACCIGETHDNVCKKHAQSSTTSRTWERTRKQLEKTKTKEKIREKEKNSEELLHSKRQGGGNGE